VSLPELPRGPLVGLLEAAPPPLAAELIGSYLESARLLGQRTAELHRALAGAADDPAFAPEAFGTLYQRSIYQSMRNTARQTFDLLRKQRRVLPEAARADGERLLGLEADVDRRLRGILNRKIAALRIRYHGDYHLGQVLYTGKDFVIIDFEGEPARPLGERRLKRSPLRDVAGMLRSFHYAVHTALADLSARGVVGATERAPLEPWARFWHTWVSTTFLRTYLTAGGEGELLPRSRTEVQLMLDVFTLDKALYELRYELNHRPDWAGIPLRGILELLETPGVEA
jgi:maltose alpha-D-glucosyltransferase/alpha-amylase